MSEFELEHYGTPRHSGRYPWGSGENPYQHSINFLSTYREMSAKGMSDTEIAKALGMKSSRELAARRAIAKNEETKYQYHRIKVLKDKGYSNVEIAKKIGIPESTIRGVIKRVESDKTEILNSTAEVLKNAVAQKKYIDIGPGTAQHMGITDTKLASAVEILKAEGYKVYQVKTTQLGNGKDLVITTLTAPETTQKEVYQNRANIKLVSDYSENKGRSYLNLERPVAVDSKRIQIKYAEEGGIEKDGVIELRRGVDDISLGNARYAQVRINVEDRVYLKGMAIYSDDLPDGVDIRFNTNKKVGTPFDKVLKPLKTVSEDSKEIDWENPFGASIKPEEALQMAQRHYVDANGKRQLSAVNVVNEEGDWAGWSKTLASQMLSKQSPELAKRQLGLAYSERKEEYEEIMSVNNPAVKKKLLDSFASACDADAVDLKAAALPNQASYVILPIPEMKATEIYAPRYENGTRVALIRYPHGSIAEIPDLVVNNRNQKGKEIITPSSIDAVGINSEVAKKLSGADFDGDTVLVIPMNSHVQLKTSRLVPSSSPLAKLQDFDPNQYENGPDAIPTKKTSFNKQLEMGKVSNLITDMTLKGAAPDEIAAAIRHSMVVIDAEKHNLDWKQSEQDNRIDQLREKYQSSSTGGASTLISRSSSPEYVAERKQVVAVSKMTPEQKAAWDRGEIVWEKTGRTAVKLYADPNQLKLTTDELIDFNSGKKIYREIDGKRKVVIDPNKMTDQEIEAFNSGKKIYRDTGKPKTFESTKMYETSDAFTLTSGGSKENPGTKMEAIYATYANQMKALGNEARRAFRTTENLKYDPAARKEYAPEVSSLLAKLNKAITAKPLERQAQLIANEQYRLKREANPNMDKDQEKKYKFQALSGARYRVGKMPYTITFEGREWEAIQKGAISHNTLSAILESADLDKVKELAMPRQSFGLSSAQSSMAKSMLSSGYTLAEVAKRFGVSTSTISKAVK